MSLLKSILMSESYRATSKLMASLAILSHGKMSGSGRSPSPSVHPHVKHQSHIWVLVYHTMWCISKVCKKNIKTNTFKENEWLNSLQLAVHRDITVVLKRKKTTDLSAIGPEQEFPLRKWERSSHCFHSHTGLPRRNFQPWQIALREGWSGALAAIGNTLAESSVLNIRTSLCSSYTTYLPPPYIPGVTTIA